MHDHRSLPSSVTEPLSRFHGAAVFVGGTGGVGRALAILLAQYATQPCQIVLIGRDEEAAEFTFSLMRASQQAMHEYVFLHCDVATHLRNVRTPVEEIERRCKRVDLVVLSTKFLSIKGRRDHSEGIDRMMATLFYSRILFIRLLLPLFSNAPHAQIVSIFNPIHAPGKLDYDDLELRHSFDVGKCSTHVATMTNLLFEDLAESYPSLSFIHAFPGIIQPDLPKPSDQIPPFSWLAKGLLKLATITPEKSAGYLMRACFEERYERGFWRVGEKGVRVESVMVETGVEARRKVREHCDEVLGRV